MFSRQNFLGSSVIVCHFAAMADFVALLSLSLFSDRLDLGGTQNIKSANGANSA